MEIIKRNNILDFLTDNEDHLVKKESFHNLILGLAFNIRDQKIETSDPLFYTIKSNNQMIACALRSNHDRPFIITEMPDQALELLIDQLINENIKLAAVVGEEKCATYFKDRWIKCKNLHFKINIHLGVYECHKVIMPKINDLEIVLGTEIHRDTILKFITGFTKDCFPNNPTDDENLKKILNRNLTNKSIILLKNKNGEILSMAANVRSTNNGGTISLVYTPKELRGNGYASLIVALLTDKILKEGKKFANLFTDLTNPTSNSIYQKIGFVKIGQNIHFDFLK